VDIVITGDRRTMYMQRSPWTNVLHRTLLMCIFNCKHFYNSHVKTCSIQRRG